MRTWLTIPVVLLVQLGTLACTDDHLADRVVRSDSAGVEVVLSTGEDRPVAWQFERQFTLGGADSGPESFYALAPGYVATDSLGRIYVLDPRSSHVVVFSTDGRFVREYGQEGEGPGELTFPGSVAVSRSSEVVVFDYGKGRLVRFEADGTVLPESPFLLRPPPTRQRHIAFLGEGMLVLSYLSPSPDDEMAYGLYAVQESDTTVVASASFPSPAGARYPSCGGGLRLPRLFEVELPWASASGAVVVSNSARYEVLLYEGLDLSRRFGRRLPVREATEEQALREVGEGFTVDFGRGPCTIDPQEVVNGRGFAPLLPWIQDLTLSPDGMVWVRRKMLGPDLAGPTDIFDSSGAYFGTIPPSAPFPLVFLDEKRFAAAETDELGVSRLVVYRIQAE